MIVNRRQESALMVAFLFRPRSRTRYTPAFLPKEKQGLWPSENGGRFRVLIPYFTPLEDADDDFGKDASKESQRTHGQHAHALGMEELDIKDEVKRLDLKIEDPDCLRARQLTQQIDVRDRRSSTSHGDRLLHCMAFALHCKDLGVSARRARRTEPRPRSKDEAKRFDLKIEDLDCITSSQLAAQINVPVVICASYTEQPDKSWMVHAEVWDIAQADM